MFAQVNCLRGDDSLIAFKKELKPVLIMSPIDTCEQIYVHFTLPWSLSVFPTEVNLPPNINLSGYESHVDSVDQTYQFNNFDLILVYGDFSIPNVNWTISDSDFVYTESITDKFWIVNQYRLLHFV